MKKLVDLKDRLILALDVQDLEEAEYLLNELQGLISTIKVNSLAAERPEVIELIKKKGFKVFRDWKYHDIPGTVANFIRADLKEGIQMSTIHATGGEEMIRYAVQAQYDSDLESHDVQILAVTILTSLDQRLFRDVGFSGVIKERVIKLALLAEKNGVDGIVCSPLETEYLRPVLKKETLIINPGITPRWKKERKDQSRTTTPYQAIINGADMLVVGSGIRTHKNPREITQVILEEIKKGLEDREENKIKAVFEKVGAMILNDHFVYKSGRHGSAYVNKNSLYQYPKEVAQLCEKIARRFIGAGVETVIGPATGGILLSQWVAHFLSILTQQTVLSVYADKDGDNFVVKRGYRDALTGKRVLVVEDITTTGGSVKKVIREVEKYAEVVGLGLLCNRGNVKFKVPTFTLLELNLQSYSAEECPLCKEDVPINQRIGQGK